jgi:hypothetical protein
MADNAAADYSIFTFNTDNIGDDMQAMSMMLHLNSVGTLLDREQLASYSGKKVGIATTAAFGGAPGTAPSSDLDPFFWGMCVGSNAFSNNKEWLKIFKDNQPIGCRDTASVDRLTKLGISGYWSGCITLHLGKKLEPVPLSERKGIIFVDVKKDEALKFIPVHIRNESLRLSSFVSSTIRGDQLERFAWLARLVDRIRHARMVVTRRLHVALPCVGLGTPVLAVPVPRISLPRFRFSGYDTFMPVRYNDEPWGNEIPFDWENPQPTKIPQNLQDGYEIFCERLRALGVFSDRVIPNASPQWPTKDNRIFRFRNPTNDNVPGAVVLRVGDKSFQPVVHDWTNREIALRLQPFPGFDRLKMSASIDWRGSNKIMDVSDLSELNGQFVAD